MLPQNISESIAETRKKTDEEIVARARAYGARASAGTSDDSLGRISASKDYRVFFGIYTGYVGCLYSPASLPLLARRSGPPLEPKQQTRVTRVNKLMLKRIEIPSDHFLDRVYRNFVSGRIALEGIEIQYDFDFVHLKCPQEIEGTVECILADEFLMKPVPLAYRTWVFQSTFEDENSIDALVHLWNAGQKSIRSIENIKQDILLKPTFESPSYLAGRYSPTIACMLSLSLCIFTLDKTAFIILALLVLFCSRIALFANVASRIGLERYISLPFRVGAGIWLWTLGTSPYIERLRPVTTSSVPGYIRLACGAILFIDIILGDIARIVRSRRSSTSYILHEILPGNVYICEVHGAGTHNITLSEAIIGPSRFEQQVNGTRFTLVAYIEGLLVELVPLSTRDFPDPYKTLDALKVVCTATFEM